MRNARIEAFWRRFLQATRRPAETPLMDCFYFDLSQRVADDLLELVLSGQKKATSSSVYAFEAEGSRLPQPGDFSVITTWDGVPRCVIQATKVTILPYREITAAMALLEGENDTLEMWRKDHLKFFTQEGQALGYVFTPDMSVVFEQFEMVYKE